MENMLAVGAGIQPREKLLDKDIQNAYLKSLNRYVFSAGEAFGLSDRHVGRASIPQGRLALLDNFTYQCPNLSDDFILKGNGSPSINYTKSAADCTEEVLSAFTFEGVQAIFTINALTGKETALAIEIERVIVPELPNTLRGLATYLRTTSVSNIEAANMPDELREVAEATRIEMSEATSATISFQNRSLDRAERELINSRKPNGHGKSSLDERDRHFYKMLQRPVPKEADLEYVAQTEGEKSAEQTPLAAAVAALTDRLANDEKSKALEATVQAQAEDIAELKAMLKKVLSKKE